MDPLGERKLESVVAHGLLFVDVLDSAVSWYIISLNTPSHARCFSMFWSGLCMPCRASLQVCARSGWSAKSMSHSLRGIAHCPKDLKNLCGCGDSGDVKRGVSCLWLHRSLWYASD